MQEQIINELGSCGNYLLMYWAHAGTNCQCTGLMREQIFNVLGSCGNKMLASSLAPANISCIGPFKLLLLVGVQVHCSNAFYRFKNFIYMGVSFCTAESSYQSEGQKINETVLLMKNNFKGPTPRENKCSKFFGLLFL